jgi:hypothetical protein
MPWHAVRDRGDPARKLAVLCWHLIIKGEDYASALPSLVAHKRRKAARRSTSHKGPQRPGHELLI